MANEAGAGAVDRASRIAGYTFVSEGCPATISGNVVALRWYGSSPASKTIKFVFFTASGNNLTVVDGSLVSISLTEEAIKGTQEYTAPGDFTAFAVTAGNYLGLYTATGGAGDTYQDYASSGGNGVWYYNGDGTSASGLGFTLGAAWIDSLSADIQTASGTIVPIVMNYYRRLRS